MKKLLTILAFIIIAGTFLTCTKDDDSRNKSNKNNKGKNNSEQEWVCGEYHGKTLYTGPKGGCYYKQDDGEKTYVDRKYCKCLK